MIQVTATDFKTNFGKYSNLISKENFHKPSVIDELIGVIPDDGYDVEQARTDRRKERENTPSYSSIHSA